MSRAVFGGGSAASAPLTIADCAAVAEKPAKRIGALAAGVSKRKHLFTKNHSVRDCSMSILITATLQCTRCPENVMITLETDVAGPAAVYRNTLSIEVDRTPTSMSLFTFDPPEGWFCLGGEWVCPACKTEGADQ